MGLKIFNASKAPIALIIRSSDKGQTWQLIKWNMENNTFIEGQWLLHKQLWTKGCSISSDGKYFYWLYNTYQDSKNYTHAGISTLPNFTAIMYGNKGNSRWDPCLFDKTTSKPINNHGLCPTDRKNIKCVNFGIPDASGLMNDEWFDERGRNIKVIGYKIFVNDILIYDATNNKFEEKNLVGEK